MIKEIDLIDILKDLPNSTSYPVQIATDGACSGNPGPGGWGAVICHAQLKKDLSGGEVLTTNNRMEMMAAIKALEALPKPMQVRLYTDSQYLKEGVTNWLNKWKKNGWKTAANKPVKNQDLWENLDQLMLIHQVDWQWVRGHTGNILNERADALARNAIIAQHMGL